MNTQSKALITQLGAAPGLGRLLDPKLELKTLHGGRSGAEVLMAIPLSLGGSPLIVKIAAHETIARERANYERFVGPILPARFRSDLLGFARAGERAVLCYSCLPISKGDAPPTLTSHLHQANAKALALVSDGLRDFLGPSWYAAAATKAELSIADRYQQRFFKDRSSIPVSEAKLAEDAARYFGAKQRGAGYSISQLAFPSPAAILFGPSARLPYRSCVIHGDLNSDNILVSPERDVVNLVDFDHVGDGHVYEDLASIEQSIRINYPQDAPFSEILERERLIAEDQPPRSGDAYAQAIADVRRAASRLFGGVEDASLYHFAIAATGLRLMQAADVSDFARARIVAGTLWATRALSTGR